MKKSHLFLGSSVLLLMVGCGGSDNTVVSQKYVHKYGFDISEQEWEQREEDGQIISTLKNGVRIVRTYENGALHGPTTYSFPSSSVVEKLLVYDQGTLLKEVTNDTAGLPMREELYEFDDRTIITLWDEKGAPISIEEYDGELLMEGKYFTADHELEGQVKGGNGERVKRDRAGLLICRDSIEQGLMTSRTSYHPNGLVHTISHYDNYQLNGIQQKFTSTGKPLMDLHWDHGILNGEKVIYRNGIKVAAIPYVEGQRNGLETHFDDLGNLTAEITWKSDKKHGCSKLYTDETIDEEWFYKGQAVSAQKFDMLLQRARMIADLPPLEINLP
ncbi:MAG: hypothetical protein KGJ02_06925 [Verrucomicrobiota bacterium]|nr:hypothetical protein [Verrucomicrobiota bacterium]